MKKLAAILFFAFLAQAQFPTVPLRTWFQASGNTISSVYPSPIPPGTGPQNVVNYSGGLYDSQRNWLVVWGGGHADYAGNEIYAFDAQTLLWSRIRNPADSFGGASNLPYYITSGGVYNTQQPRARHTYSALEYCPDVDRYVALGATATYIAADAATVVNRYNPAANTWDSVATMPMPFNTVISAWDATTGKVWFHGNASSAWLAELNCSTGAFINHGDIFSDGNINTGVTGIIHPPSRAFLAFGNNVSRRFDMSNPGFEPQETLPNRGSSRIYSAVRPGLAYCPVDSMIIGWAGGDTLARWDWRDSTWYDVPPDPGNTVHPGAQQGNGTSGRFRQVSGMSGCVYIQVSSTTGSTYFYRYKDAAASTWGPFGNNDIFRLKVGF